MLGPGGAAGCWGHRPGSNPQLQPQHSKGALGTEASSIFIPTWCIWGGGQLLFSLPAPLDSQPSPLCYHQPSPGRRSPLLVHGSSVASCCPRGKGSPVAARHGPLAALSAPWLLSGQPPSSLPLGTLPLEAFSDLLLVSCSLVPGSALRAMGGPQAQGLEGDGGYQAPVGSPGPGTGWHSDAQGCSLDGWVRK